jgi:AMP-activated protein kinase-like protein
LTGKLAAVGAALALVTAAPLLSAQQVRVRFGGVHAQYADTVTGAAGTLTSEFNWAGPKVQGTFDASFTQFTSGPWAVQGAGGVFGIRFLRSNFGVGLRAEGDGGYLSDHIWSSSGLAGPVVAFVPGNWVLSGGLSAGAVRRIDRASLLAFEGNATVRRDLGPWGLEAGASFTRAGPVHFADASIGAEVRVSTVTIGGLAGARSGDLGSRPWYQGRASVELAPSASLEISAGTYPRDLSGFIAGSYLSIGVWLGVGRQARAVSSSEVIRRLASGRSSITVESPEPGHQQVTFHVPGARSVAIAGEWNDWTPVALQRLDDGRWRANLALTQGAHRFSLVVDGQKWMVPPGVATLPDDMGGHVGLLIVDQ